MKALLQQALEPLRTASKALSEYGATGEIDDLLTAQAGLELVIEQFEQHIAQAEQPVAWARSWHIAKEVPCKEKNGNGNLAWPAKFKLLPVTAGKCMRDDVPLYTHPQAAKPLSEPDQFWNDDDRERNYSSISEFLNEEICNGTPVEVGSTFTLLRAVSLPKITIRVTSVDEEQCEADWEIVEAAHGIKEQQP